jgi:hypothetical protein
MILEIGQTFSDGIFIESRRPVLIKDYAGPASNDQSQSDYPEHFHRAAPKKKAPESLTFLVIDSEGTPNERNYNRRNKDPRRPECDGREPLLLGNE